MIQSNTPTRSTNTFILSTDKPTLEFDLDNENSFFPIDEFICRFEYPEYKWENVLIENSVKVEVKLSCNNSNHSARYEILVDILLPAGKNPSAKFGGSLEIPSREYREALDVFELLHYDKMELTLLQKNATPKFSIEFINV